MSIHTDPAPCPFCGGAAAAVVSADHDNPGRGVAYVSCDVCGAESGSVRWSCTDRGLPVDARAIIAWNLRASDALVPPDGLMDPLDDLLARARRHGEEGPFEEGATHEVGDLQQILALAWEQLDDAQKAFVHSAALELVYDNEPASPR